MTLREYNRGMTMVMPVRVSPDVRLWLNEQAKREDRSVASLLRRIVSEAMNHAASKDGPAQGSALVEGQEQS